MHKYLGFHFVCMRNILVKIEYNINVQFSVRYTLYTVVFTFDLYSANNLNPMLNMNIFIKELINNSYGNNNINEKVVLNIRLKGK
jgi:hypothetical protein